MNYSEIANGHTRLLPSKILRNLGISVIACALGLGSLIAPAQSQNKKSEINQKNANMTQTTAERQSGGQSADKEAIRPFRVNFPEAKLIELRRRIAATQWPEKETVSDSSQGVPLTTMQELARYWMTDYDWRKVEVKLNALPQFITN